MKVDPTGENPYAGARGAWWIGTRIGGGINYGIQALTGATIGTLIYDMCNDEECPPCRTISGRTVPVGTIGYRPLDTPDRPQHGIVGPHYNLYRANQNPNNCQYFWQPIKPVPAAALPSGAIPIEPFVN